MYAFYSVPLRKYLLLLSIEVGSASFNEPSNYCNMLLFTAVLLCLLIA
nr:MAG TPA: hypothetical protein [Bacteriophage sp.]